MHAGVDAQHRRSRSIVSNLVRYEVQSWEEAEGRRTRDEERGTKEAVAEVDGRSDRGDAVDGQVATSQRTGLERKEVAKQEDVAINTHAGDLYNQARLHEPELHEPELPVVLWHPPPTYIAGV